MSFKNILHGMHGIGLLAEFLVEHGLIISNMELPGSQRGTPNVGMSCDIRGSRIVLGYDSKMIGDHHALEATHLGQAVMQALLQHL
jgi:hypothetical protein